MGEPTTLTGHYDDYYESGTSRWRELGAVERADTIIQAWRSADGPPRPSVLDIGCGEGAIGAELLKRQFFSRYTGLEISSSGIEAARGRGLTLDYALFDGSRIPYEDADFDYAVMSHVVEHLEHPRTLLREAARAARFVFVEVPLEYHLRTPRDFRWTNVGHVNLYNPKLIRQLIQSSGLEVLKEWVSNNRLDLSKMRYGSRKGAARWIAREGLLRTSPRLATSVFTFNGNLLARAALT